MNENRLEIFEAFVTDFIIEYFAAKNEKAAILFNLLTLSQKVDIFEYLTKTPILEHPLYLKQFENVDQTTRIPQVPTGHE